MLSSIFVNLPAKFLLKVHINVGELLKHRHWRVNHHYRGLMHILSWPYYKVSACLVRGLLSGHHFTLRTRSFLLFPPNLWEWLIQDLISCPLCDSLFQHLKLYLLLLPVCIVLTFQWGGSSELNRGDLFWSKGWLLFLLVQTCNLDLLLLIKVIQVANECDN